MPAIELYGYQKAAVAEVLQNISDGVPSQILSAPTGSGKTECSMAIIAHAVQEGMRAEFICDRQQLVRQTSARFWKAGIRHGVLMGDESVGTREPIRVSSAQTIHSRGMRENKLVIVDECHELREGVLKAVKRTEASLVGMTATPFPPVLGKWYGRIVNAITTNRLLLDGVLCPFSVIAPTAEVNTNGLKAVGPGGEWRPADVSERAVRIVGDAVREWRRVIRERYDGHEQPTVLFAATIDDAEVFAQRFQQAGHDFRIVSSREPTEKNKQTLDAYDRGEFVGLINVAILARGWDAPSTRILVDCYPLRKSLLTLVQRYGRIMRTAPGKDKALIVDHASNWLGFREKVLRFYNEGPPPLGDDSAHKAIRQEVQAKGQSICRKCRQVFERGDTECQGCGAKRPKRQTGGMAGTVKTIDGVLSLVDDVTGEAAAYSGTDLWHELCAIAWEDTNQEPGKARKRALATYKAITQRWPAWDIPFNATAKKPSDATRKMVKANFRAWLESKREQERRGAA